MMRLQAILICVCLFSSFILVQGQMVSDAQLSVNNIDCLHQRGYTGKGITIAHLDDGCKACNDLPSLEYTRSNGYWLNGYDFVENTDLGFDRNGSHGTSTISLVHGYLPGKYIGAAYDANLLIARTEDRNHESHQEELYWKAAMLWSIKNGADIITSSLQYNTFDKGEEDYTYADMDGNTSWIAHAADYAASKGLIVVTLQGNYGKSKWHFLTTPGDADSVLTVGAVNRRGKIAKFSGFGPSYDERIKPDVLAMGVKTAVVLSSGKIRKRNGTSYAAPLMAGMLACLKQAHPMRTNMQIISAVRQSSTLYYKPEKKGRTGYGIADGCKADDILTEIDLSVVDVQNKWFEKTHFNWIRTGERVTFQTSGSIKITSLRVKDLLERTLQVFKGPTIDFTEFPSGDYLIDVFLDNGEVETIFFNK